MHQDPSATSRLGPLASGTRGCYATVWGCFMGQAPATASAPRGTRWHSAGTVPAVGSVSGHCPAFRHSLRDGVISGSSSSISASKAAHSSPWALLWAQPRLLYNLGFPEKLKREMKDTISPPTRSFQNPEHGVLSLVLPSSTTSQREETCPAGAGGGDPYPVHSAPRRGTGRAPESRPRTPRCSKGSSCCKPLKAPGWATHSRQHQPGKGIVL